MGEEYGLSAPMGEEYGLSAPMGEEYGLSAPMGEGYGETKCPHHLAAAHRAQSQFLDLHGLIRQRVFIFFQAIGHFFWISFMNPTEMGCNIFHVT